jgi:hypothetical protein
MPSMTAISRNSKVLLVADVRNDACLPGGAGAVRRYRLARVRLDPPAAGAQARSERRKRVPA